METDFETPIEAIEVNVEELEPKIVPESTAGFLE